MGSCAVRLFELLVFHLPLYIFEMLRRCDSIVIGRYPSGSYPSRIHTLQLRSPLSEIYCWLVGMVFVTASFYDGIVPACIRLGLIFLFQSVLCRGSSPTVQHCSYDGIVF